MKSYKLIFHYISYLQYPLLVISLFFAYQPIFFDVETVWTPLNKALVFMGLAISFSTLQDTTKTQNKLSLRVYQNPKYAKYFIIYLVLLTLTFLIFGIFGLLFSKNENFQAIAFGSITLGIGMIGMLKVAIEMAEYHGKKH